MADDGPPSRSNLNFFYTLDAILNAPTLTEAARTTHLSQPAISMALKKARAHFGDEIVTYDGGRRQLTELAIALRPRIRRTLREAQQILDLTLDFDPNVDRRTLRLTMPDFVEVIFLPHVLRAVRAVAPYVDLSIVPFDYWPAKRQFEKDIDFALLPTPLLDSDYGSVPLYHEELCAMVGTRNPLAKSVADGRTYDMDALPRAQYESSFHAALFDSVDMLMPRSGPLADLLAKRNVVARTALYATLPRMVMDTDLIVTTSARYAQYCASIMEVVCLPLPIPSEKVMIHLQWQNFRQDEPLLRWFSKIMGDATSFV